MEHAGAAAAPTVDGRATNTAAENMRATAPVSAINIRVLLATELTHTPHNSAAARTDL
jgi:hypothetical protein